MWTRQSNALCAPTDQPRGAADFPYWAVGRQSFTILIDCRCWKLELQDVRITRATLSHQGAAVGSSQLPSAAVLSPSATANRVRRRSSTPNILFACPAACFIPFLRSPARFHLACPFSRPSFAAVFPSWPSAMPMATTPRALPALPATVRWRTWTRRWPR